MPGETTAVYRRRHVTLLLIQATKQGEAEWLTLHRPIQPKVARPPKPDSLSPHNTTGSLSTPPFSALFRGKCCSNRR